MKRRWFQIHLSTSVVLAIVASTMLYLNCFPPHMEGLHGFPVQWDGGEGIPVVFLLTLDLIFAILELIFAWAVCEYAITLGEARKP
jgi:hypothetical protein